MIAAQYDRCPKGHQTTKLRGIIESKPRKKPVAWICKKCNIIFTDPILGTLDVISMDLSLPANMTMDGNVFTTKEDRQRQLGMLRHA